MTGNLSEDGLISEGEKKKLEDHGAKVKRKKKKKKNLGECQLFTMFFFSGGVRTELLGLETQLYLLRPCTTFRSNCTAVTMFLLLILIIPIILMIISL